MALPSEIDGRSHLFLLEAARAWFDVGGNPCELQRSNPAGTRRKQPVWTFWLDQAQNTTDEAGWDDLVHQAVRADGFDPWLPDHNGNPSWWRTLVITSDVDAQGWSRHWLDQGLDPNRWNTESPPATPCLLAAWLRTSLSLGITPDAVVGLLDTWVRERALDPHGVDTASGNGAWHWLATHRPLSTLDGQVRFATWLLDHHVSPERCNRAGASGWEAWSATMPRAALDAVAPVWARQQQAQLHALQGEDGGQDLPTAVLPLRRARL